METTIMHKELLFADVHLLYTASIKYSQQSGAKKALRVVKLISQTFSIAKRFSAVNDPSITISLRINNDNSLSNQSHRV